MSTILNTNGAELEIPKIKVPKEFRVAIVTAKWNPQLTHALRDGAHDVFIKAGALEENILHYDVPGTVELVYAAGRLVKMDEFDAVIVIGCVIRGDTPHFDYVCEQAAVGIAHINAEGQTPVIFGVLTVDNLQQALDRAGGSLGNKGSEAAVAAIEMADFRRTLMYDSLDLTF